MNVFAEMGLSRRRRLPVVISSELAECGLVCMVMIGRFHGHEIDLNGLRQRYPLSMSGATLRSLMGLADQLGFTTRALRVDMAALAQVKVPAVLHWDLNHFVVLKRVNKRRAVVHDPGQGVRSYSLDEISKHFTGVVLEVSPAAHFSKVKATVPTRLSSLWSESTGLWTSISQVLVLSAALQLAAFAAPFQIQLIVDDAIARSDRVLLTVLALGFGALVIVQAGLDALRGWTIQVLGNLLTLQIVGNLVRHLLRLPADFFEKRHVGDILSRLNSSQAIQDLIARGAASALIDGSMALIAVFVLFVYSPTLAAIVVLSTVLSLAVALGFYPMMRRRTEEQLVSSAVERTHLMESVRAATTIKLMGREQEREGRWRNLFAKVINSNLEVARYQISVSLGQTLLMGLSTILVIYLGARTILEGRGLSVGMLLAFLSFRQTFTDRTTSLINQTVQLKLVKLHLDRIGEIVNAEPESTFSGIPPGQIQGGISLTNIAFRYGASDPWVLKDLDLDISPGELVAISGPSGGGKTTLVKLMLGLHRPTEGEVLLDGKPATPELWRAWRQQVSVVAQDDRLLSGSLADNISFFDPDLDMTKVIGAATAAQIHDDIMRMPMQYLSLIGDMGSSLSGGQRQRVLLARALYRQPSLLILDEGTANLDEANENAIAQLVAALPMTRIVVAHRSALLQHAARVIQMENGKAKIMMMRPMVVA